MSARAVLVLALLTAAGCGGSGQPPVSAGSSLPGLATGPDATVLSWVEPAGDGHRLVYATLRGDTWSEPRTVAEGTGWFVNWADVPSVVPITEALWAAHWLVKRPGGSYAYDIALALSTDGGRSWSEPLRPHDDGTPTEHGFVSMWPAEHDGAAAVGLAWLDGRHMQVDPSRTVEDQRTTLRSAVVTATGAVTARTEVDGRVCDCCPTAVASTPDGAALVYRDRTRDEIRDIHLARWSASGWTPGGAVADDGWRINGCPVNGPALAAAGDALAAAWYTEAGGTRRVRVARLESPDAHWSAPVDIAVRVPLGRVDLVWLDDASVAVSWLEEAAGGMAELRLARIGRDGQGAPLTVAATLASRPAGMPRLLRHGDDLLLAWTHWEDDTPRIRTARVPLARLPAPG